MRLDLRLVDLGAADRDVAEDLVVLRLPSLATEVALTVGAHYIEVL